MSNLISKEKAYEVLSEYYHHKTEIQHKALREALDRVPTEERKKGKWIHGRELSREMIGNVITAIFYEGWKCSECHCLVQEEREPLWKYCPNCGAKMEMEHEE